MSLFPSATSEFMSAPDLTGVWRAIVGFLIVGLLTVLHPIPVTASNEFAPSSVEKGALLVASPSLVDPNFQKTVVLILEHGSAGTLGLVLNRPTKILLSEALPDLAVLKGTGYRLFAGGPVQPDRLLLLFRLKEPPAGAHLIFDGIYMGDTPKILEGIVKQSKPTDTFRAFAGSARWAPGQLKYEMLHGAWAVLPPDSIGIFDKDPATFWQDCVSRLQAPRVISYEREMKRQPCRPLCSRNVHGKTVLVRSAKNRQSRDIGVSTLTREQTTKTFSIS